MSSLKELLADSEQENIKLREQLREAITQVTVLESKVQQFDHWRDTLTESVERIDKAGEAMGLRLAQLEAALGEATSALASWPGQEKLVERFQAVLNDR
jgi:chromosome segregation ATPase